MTLHLIVAMDEGRVIGRNNDLPWHLPADLRRFRRLTTGHPIVMGRRTWDSIGRALPGRVSIVVTRQRPFDVPEGVLVAGSLLAALHAAGDAEDVFVIGGASLYAAALPVADRLHVTRVHTSVDGDVHFPEWDEEEWTLEEEEHRAADDRNPHDLTFQAYRRTQDRRPAGR